MTSPRGSLRRSFITSTEFSVERRSLVSSYGEAATRAILVERFETKFPTPKNARTSAPPSMTRESFMPLTFPLTGMIEIVPKSSLVFNAPYDDKQLGRLKIMNTSGRAIGFAIKATNTKRLTITPDHGILQPKDSITIAVGCEAFRVGKDVRPDLLIVEWVSVPDGPSPTFRRLWLRQGDGRRKNITVLYNH
uniref:Major sperm protein n=1 Tax=Panagrellus redivivus TaxID=6233 RepID=A0A7E4UYR4_PANRE